MPPNNNLRGLEKITEFLKIIFESGNIDDKIDKPLSVILIAPVSSGKTTAIKQFKNNKNILITTDSTAYGILKKYENSLKNSEIKHIIIPDLHSALARKKTTAEQLILFINNSSEDGIFPSQTYGMSINNYIKPFGWILCLTTEGFKRKFKFLKEIGFISRFFVIEYKYDLSQIQLIIENIINEKDIEIPDIKINSMKTRKKIRGNPKVFRELIVYSKILCKEGDSEILRMQKKLQTFLKANASLNKRKQVTNEDLNKLKELIDLIK